MNKIFTLFAFIFVLTASAPAQITPPSNTPSADGISLAPARVELEMKPGTETTFVINLDYRSTGGAAQPARIVASLNDWDITKDGRVEFYKANTRPNSASSWIIYSPAETTVTPGNIHSIRVTVSVPGDAAPGDHLAALIVEQRPDSIKLSQNTRKMIVNYRLASVFYIKVPNLVRRGTLQNLQAQANEKGIVVTPTLKNEGNSLVRPTASVKILDSKNSVVAELAGVESLPLLGGAELSQPLLIEKTLAPGSYTVKYRIDFQDGNRATEGIADFVVKDSPPRENPSTIAKTPAKP